MFLFSLLALASMPVLAGGVLGSSPLDSQSGAAAMLYWKQPFGGGSQTREGSSYGLHLNSDYHPLAVHPDGSSNVNDPALLDIRFHNNGFDGLRVKGSGFLEGGRLPADLFERLKGSGGSGCGSACGSQ